MFSYIFSLIMPVNHLLIDYDLMYDGSDLHLHLVFW